MHLFVEYFGCLPGTLWGDHACPEVLVGGDVWNVDVKPGAYLHVTCQMNCENGFQNIILR